MATLYNPGITMDNLVFYLDAANPKSMPGEGTTNLNTAQTLSGMQNITLTYIGLEDGWKKYSMSGTFTGGTYPYIMNIAPSVTFTGGVQYSTRCTVKTNVLGKFNYFGANGIEYVNEPLTINGTMSSTINSDGSRTIAREGFAYTNTTNQVGYIYSNPINNTTFNASTDFVWVKDIQVEQKAYSTPYVDGTRPPTWFDLSGRGYNATFTNSPRVLNNTVQFRSASSQYATATFDEGVLRASNELGMWTIEALFKQVSNANNNEAMVIGRQGCHGGIYIDTNTINHAIKTSETNCWTGAVFPIVQTMTNGSWYHTAMIYENGLIKSYVNGVNTANTTFNRNTYNMAGYGTTVWIGGIPSMLTNIDLSFVRCYNTALSESQVLRNYASLIGRMI